MLRLGHSRLEVKAYLSLGPDWFPRKLKDPRYRDEIIEAINEGRNQLINRYQTVAAIAYSKTIDPETQLQHTLQWIDRFGPQSKSCQQTIAYERAMELAAATAAAQSCGASSITVTAEESSAIIEEFVGSVTPSLNREVETTRRRLFAAPEKRIQAALAHFWGSDPARFIADAVWFQNPRKSPVDIPVVPYEYQIPLIEAICGAGDKGRPDSGADWNVILLKSRELGATWIIAACLLWKFCFGEPGEFGVLTRVGAELFSKSTGSLFGKFQFMLGKLPQWLTAPWGIQVRHSAPYEISRADNKSAILGAATTDDPFRGRRLRSVFVDEAAAIPKLDPVLRSLQDAAMQVVLASTPRGRANTFSDVWHGVYGQTREWGETESGWLRLRWHYSQHPERDPETAAGAAWVAEARSTRTAESWAQEQECDFDISAPGRVWPEFGVQKHVFSANRWREILAELANCQTIEGWDFGSGESLTACVQVAYYEGADAIYILDYRQWHSAPYSQVAEDYQSFLSRPLGRAIDFRFGDVAGKQRDSSQRSWIRNLDSVGLSIHPRALTDGEGLRERIREAIRTGRLYCSPRCAVRNVDGLPTMVEVMSQYRRAPKSAGGGTPPPLKDIYSHAADALQYAADYVWSPKSGIRYQDDPEQIIGRRNGLPVNVNKMGKELRRPR
jgi:hypothetical protein